MNYGARTTKVRLICSYDYLLASRAMLPLFVSFLPHNQVCLSITPEVYYDVNKKRTLMSIVNNWFKNLRELSYEQTETTGNEKQVKSNAEAKSLACSSGTY